MEKIGSNIYLEKDYPGVTVGAVPLGDGVIFIDAPLRPDDGRTWLSTLRGLKGGADRLLVFLDSHPDRTLGARVLESTIISHNEVYRAFDDRSSIFKAQLPETGSEWETCTGLSGIRWVSPHMAFSKDARLHWKDAELILEHHPGPEDGAIWAILPEEEVIFIGDLVTTHQPPFLAEADLLAWDQSLEALADSEYKDYVKISSRDGMIDDKDIRSMRKFINGLHKQFERMARRKTKPQNVEKMVDKQLSNFEFPPRYHNNYYQRLLYGMQECYTVKYYALQTGTEEQDE